MNTNEMILDRDGRPFSDFTVAEQVAAVLSRETCGQFTITSHDGGYGLVRQARSPDIRIGAVITYYDTGTKKPCGQTVGADGSGGYCVVFLGDPGQAEEAAREYIKKIDKHARGRIKEVHLVSALETYHGSPVLVIDLNTSCASKEDCCGLAS